MFNPFDGVIMEKFLKNNIEKLKKNKSVIAYCNYIEIETLKILQRYNFYRKIQTCSDKVLN